MKRLFLVLALTFSLFGMAQAQVREPYAGVGLVLGLPYNGLGNSLFSIQGGAAVADNLEVRAAADLFWIFTVGGAVSVDVLYSFPVSDAFDLYLGVGPSLFYSNPDAFGFGSNTSPIEFTVSANALAGLEYAFNSGVGVYGEVKVPVSEVIRSRSFGGLLRTGVNFYF